MQQVNRRKVYRIESHSGSHWKLNEQRIYTKGKKNNFYKSFLGVDVNLVDQNQSYGLLSDIVKKLHNKIMKKGLESITNLKKKEKFQSVRDNVLLGTIIKGFGDTLTIKRELILEQVRINTNPNLPSRYSCLYVIPNQSALQFWQNIFSYNSQNSNYQIVELEITGDLHVGDYNLLVDSTKSVDNLIQDYQKYWNYNQKNSVHEEGIFEGEAECIRIL
ncbi:DUF2441 domain-containing protein [Mycoplasmatota bacterium WC44]